MSLSGDISAAVDAAASSGPTDASPASSAPTTGAASPAATTPASPPGVPARAGSARTQTLPTPTPAPAIAAPATPGSDAIPLERHRQVLESTRAKAREELIQHYGIAPEAFQASNYRAHYEAFQRDPAAYYQALGPALRQAGLLPQEQAPDSRPTPDLRAEDGTVAYSAQAIERLLQQQRGEMLAEFQQTMAQRLSPLEAAHQQTIQASLTQSAKDYAGRQLGDAQTWEGFEELRPQIHAAMKADGRVTLESAYNRLFQTVYLPKFKQQTRERVLTEIKAAPPVPASVRPANGATPPRASKAPRRTQDRVIDDALRSALASQGA